MSVQNNQSTTYASPDDVARYFRPRDPDADTFTHDTSPTRRDVEKHLESASAEIDRYTQQSWRANQVVDETHDHDGLYYWLSGHPINLNYREIHRLDPEEGDKIEVWTGNQWANWLDEEDIGRFEYGRDKDWWVDRANGILWIYERAILRPHPKFRITYRYGYEQVPADIRDACARLAAADIVSGDFYGSAVSGSNRSGDDPADAANRWEERAYKTLQRYKSISWV